MSAGFRHVCKNRFTAARFQCVTSQSPHVIGSFLLLFMWVVCTCANFGRISWLEKGKSNVNKKREIGANVMGAENVSAQKWLVKDNIFVDLK